MEAPTSIGLKITLHTDFATAEARITEALKSQGFGVLTEIDVKATLKNKLDVDFRPYKILGACNPPIAHQALSTVADVGLLLPCNVTLSQNDDGTIDVAFLDPMLMSSIFDNPTLITIAQEARQRLDNVIAQLAAQNN